MDAEITVAVPDISSTADAVRLWTHSSHHRARLFVVCHPTDLHRLPMLIAQHRACHARAGT